MRAYDHLLNEYRDFVLTRVTRAALDPEAGTYVGAELDASWTRFSTVVIEDAGAVAGGAPRTGIQLDFDLNDRGRREVQVREALVPYLVDEITEEYSNPVIVYEVGKAPPLRAADRKD